nr:hypothetical protein [Tanacetum cinerariifolium]
EVVHKELGDSLVRAATTASSLKAEQDSGGGPRFQEAIEDTTTQTKFEIVSKHSNDSLLARGSTLQSDEDRIKLNELMKLCTNLQSKVLELEKTKTTQQNVIDSLKRRVKRLKKNNRSRTHKLKRLYKVGLTAKVESLDEESLGDDASKQGRRIDDICNAPLRKEDGEGSGTPTEPHHTPSPELTSSHPSTSSIPLPSIPTAPIPPVNQIGTTPIIQYIRRARIAQSSALSTVADEPASPVRDDSQGEACPTDYGFIADQDRATIAKSSTLPHDSAPKVTSPDAEEGNKSRDDAPIKGRSNNEGEASAERISNDSEEIARVLTSMDATTVLAGEANVPTGSGFILTTGPPATIVSTGSEVGPTTSVTPLFVKKTLLKLVPLLVQLLLLIQEKRTKKLW